MVICVETKSPLKDMAMLEYKNEKGRSTDDEARNKYGHQITTLFSDCSFGDASKTITTYYIWQEQKQPISVEQRFSDAIIEVT